MNKLSTGIQTFREIREEGYGYVDKTPLGIIAQKYAGQPMTLIGMDFSNVERNRVGCEGRRLP